jgi:hypothetical protein
MDYSLPTTDYRSHFFDSPGSGNKAEINPIGLFGCWLQL